MGWVLTAGDQLIEISSSGSIGTEVSHGGMVPGILVGRGGMRPGTSEENFAPNQTELQEIARFAKELGRRLSRHQNFDRHFKSHKKLLENALETSYPADRNGEDAFLSDLGELIATGKLTALGIVTLGKNQRMAYAYQGRIGMSDLTAVVFPNGQWNTLLSTGQGKAAGFFWQMRFDKRFPFPFMHPSGAGSSRQYL